MRNAKSGEEEFKATMTSPMRDVTNQKLEPIDIWPYVERVSASELRGYEIYERLVEYVYRSGDGRFEHLLVMTKTKNVYLAVVVDVKLRAVHGHHVLDLNALYGA